MTMNFQITSAAQNAACDAIVDLLDGGSAAATIKVYSGTQPADANTALSGNTLLVTFTCSSTAFGDSASGTATLASTPITGTAVATGTASFFRAATGGTGGTGTVFDGSVGTSSADFILNTTSITSGLDVTLSSGTVTVPAHA
jgi:hypothetical protein